MMMTSPADHDRSKKKKKMAEVEEAASCRMSGIFMAMILVAAASGSFSLGRYCQSHVPISLQRKLQQRVDSMRMLPLVAVVSPRNSHLILQKDDDVADAVVSSSSNDDDDDNDNVVAVSNGAEHLMIDVTNADPDFLGSPDRLETALLTLLQDHWNGQKLLSLRRTNHAARGGGISLTVLLLDSHVFLHAWPSIGVLTLDIYKSQGHTSVSQGNNNEDDDSENIKPVSLLALRPVIEKLFAIGKSGSSNDDAKQSPHFYWAIKHRGLDYDTYKEDPSDSADFRMHYLGRRAFTHKELVSVVETPFQTYEVYDLTDIRDAHQRTDRILFLDYVSQSSRLGLEAYHEALVHPSLFTHPNPKRVAIVGGGEGATLREVLKHSTVNQVVMIEIDGAMMNASRTALLEWNDCSDLVGNAGSCFDDPRAEVYAADAARWFLDRFHDKDIAEEEKFDVIIMDALDPSSLVKFSDVLYGNVALAQSMHSALTEQGILVAQLGIADRPFNPGHHHRAESDAVMRMVQLFEEVGFQYATTYVEEHCGFHAPWSFFVFFRDETNTKTRWYASPANVDLEVSQRAVATISGDFPFKYFDGATMMTYQYPTKAEQNVYCRTFPHAAGCRTARYLDALDKSYLSKALPTTTTTAVSNTTCPPASYRRQSVQSLSIVPSTAQLVSETSLLFPGMNALESGIKNHGHEHLFYGKSGYVVNPFTMHTQQHEAPSTDNGGDKDLLTAEDDDTVPHLNPFAARNHDWIMASTNSVHPLANGVDCTEVFED